MLHCLQKVPGGVGPLIVSLDANFGLVRKQSSGRSTEPPKHGDLAFLSDDAAKEFVDGYNARQKPDDQVSSIFLILY